MIVSREHSFTYCASHRITHRHRYETMKWNWLLRGGEEETGRVETCFIAALLLLLRILNYTMELEFEILWDAKWEDKAFVQSVYGVHTYIRRRVNKFHRKIRNGRITSIHTTNTLQPHRPHTAFVSHFIHIYVCASSSPTSSVLFCVFSSSDK